MAPEITMPRSPVRYWPNCRGWANALVSSFKRSARQGPFERDDINTLNRVLPHLRSVARQAAIVMRSHFEGEIEAFSRLHRGALWLDEQGRILAMNDRVVFGDGLVCEGGRLSAASSADRHALALAIGGQKGTGAPAPTGPLVVGRPSGKRPYVVDVIGVPAGDLADSRRTCTIVLVNDLDAEVRPRRESIQRCFDLTPRETDLAQQLCHGATLREAAQALQISEAHARQRLMVLMAKTQTSRQSEMLALFARLS